MTKEKEQQLQKRETAAVSTAMPDFLKDIRSQAGMEDVRQEDMKVPRLALSQKMSPEMDPDKPENILGLKLGEAFNTVTQEIYGKGPFLVTPLKQSKQRMKFAEAGGIECVSYNGETGGQITPEGCDKCPFSQFETDGDGKSVPPACDLFRNYVVLMHRAGERDLSADPLSERTIVVSLKSKGLKVSKKWLGLISLRNKPIYAGVYQLDVVKEQAPKGDFYNFTVQNAGWITDKALYDELEKQHEFFKSVQVDAGISKKEPEAGGEEVPF